MIRHNVEQRTEEWHELRYGKIGGTGSKGLHVSSDTLLYELASCRLEPFEYEENYPTAAMQRGIDLEPLAFEQASRYIGKKFIEYGWIETEECSIIGYSPDGLTIRGADGLELKCPSAKVHLKYLTEDIIPIEYTHQIAHAFTVNKKLQRMYFASFRPECEIPLFVKMVSRTDEMNMGTAARPKMQVVNDVAIEKLALAQELEKQIVTVINKVKF